ncbi:MAG: peroxide stress protein YaaA [Chitinophagales bacterium]|nr:peroxide stress protein YaaA [Chitinophagales bacterium]
MLLVLSPAKSLELSKPIDCTIVTQPLFETEKKPVVDMLKKMKLKAIADTFSLSEKLAMLNYERYQALGTKENIKNSRQAIFTFDGEVYLGFDAYSLDKKKFAYTQENVRILSGLYGVLRPFDLMEPYRLEMGSKVSIGKSKNLYAFWSERVTQCINEDLKPSTHLLNLASQEYFKVINQRSLIKPVLNFDFLELDKGLYKNISFFSKKARGLMARYVVDNKVNKIALLKEFDIERYQFNMDLSTEDKLVFTRKFQPIGKK